MIIIYNLYPAEPEPNKLKLLLRVYGSAQLSGEAPGLQIRCGALKPSRVGSIPMHFRHTFTSSTLCKILQNIA